MTTVLRPLIISLRPCYADLVFEGLKKAEAPTTDCCPN